MEASKLKFTEMAADESQIVRLRAHSSCSSGDSDVLLTPMVTAIDVSAKETAASLPHFDVMGGVSRAAISEHPAILAIMSDIESLRHRFGHLEAIVHPKDRDVVITCTEPLPLPSRPPSVLLLDEMYHPVSLFKPRCN